MTFWAEGCRLHAWCDCGYCGLPSLTYHSLVLAVEDFPRELIAAGIMHANNNTNARSRIVAKPLKVSVSFCGPAFVVAGGRFDAPSGLGNPAGAPFARIGWLAGGGDLARRLLG